jgi:FkbM family methyltransferase
MSTDHERAFLLESLRANARTSLAQRKLMAEIRHSDLPQRMAVLSACATNNYQPATTGVLLPTGDHLQIQLREEVSQQLFLYGGYEETLTLAVMRALSPGSVFFDVGAHYGYFSVLASRFVGGHGRVVAFEPGPSAFSKLSINLSGRENCECHQKAVWRVSGPLSFNDAGDDRSAFSSTSDLRLVSGSRSDGTTAVEVDATSLDDFVRRTDLRPDVIKIDVESAELDVIMGAQEILATCRPMLTIEVGDFPQLIQRGVPTSRTVLEALIERDYDLFEARMDGLEPHRLREDLYEYDNIVALPKSTRFAELRP